MTNPRLMFAFITIFCTLAGTAHLSAQNLVVTNARIIDGTGRVIDRGSIVVRDGRIASVSAGAAAPAGLTQVDARGMTVTAGFIDAHRHFPTDGNDIQLRMQEFLEAGYTTLLHGGGSVPGIVEFKHTAINQRGEVVAECTRQALMKKKPKA